MSEAKRSYHHGDLRNALIEVTFALVEEKGSNGFSVSEAARRAGVSVAAPYRHFADREALIRAASASGFDALHLALVAASEIIDDSDELAEELAVRYVQFAQASPSRFRLMFSSGIDKSTSPELLAAVMRPRRVLEEAVQGLPALSISTDEGATALWSIAHGVATLTIEGLLSDTTTPEQTVGLLVRSWLAGARRHESPEQLTAT